MNVAIISYYALIAQTSAAPIGLGIIYGFGLSVAEGIVSYSPFVNV